MTVHDPDLSGDPLPELADSDWAYRMSAIANISHNLRDELTGGAW